MGAAGAGAAGAAASGSRGGRDEEKKDWAPVTSWAASHDGKAGRWRRLPELVPHQGGDCDYFLGPAEDEVIKIMPVQKAPAKARA